MSKHTHTHTYIQKHTHTDAGKRERDRERLCCIRAKDDRGSQRSSGRSSSASESLQLRPPVALFLVPETTERRTPQSNTLPPTTSRRSRTYIFVLFFPLSSLPPQSQKLASIALEEDLFLVLQNLRHHEVSLYQLPFRKAADK